ncbi:helix-turn-helix domain-containing protein [Streptomyces physcomitrii]|uniref:Helix-turn-helix domain-containing protein n=1 Tax=Streptomyces physcomitrii TaxID=2724184 RepID=A0ABX1GVZ1_9ACTN|nr:helix-turn-helix domain-containing protein [Streptomyces physcomitrii]NKI40243.1 helix-turn-helix domain-containing protein [Streptomyces physcomitrii]
MIELEFRGDDLSGAERFAHWRELALKRPAPVTVRAEDTERFAANLRLLALGPVQVSEVTSPSLWSFRTAALIRRSDPELYELTLPLQGRSYVAQEGVTTEHTAGALVLSSTSHPFETGVRAARGPARVAKIYLPRSLLSVPAPAADSLLARPLPADSGIGALFTQFVTGLLADSSAYGPADGPRLGTVLLNLSVALLAHHTDEERRLPPESRSRTLFLQIQDFVRRNLGDPSLSPETVAAAHHISTRYLHRLFQDHELTVGGWIRTERLERCVRDLTDPKQRHTPISELAARWGFSHPAAFSRAFRAAYGSSPSEYRAHHRLRLVG